MKFSRAVIAAWLTLAALSPTVAMADPAKNIQVAARVLTFLEKAPSGTTVIGVVFDRAKPESVAEKNAIMAALGAGYRVGAVTIVGKPMDQQSIGGASTIFLTRGVNYAAVGADARARGVITIGSDLSCVESGACAVGVSTDPTVTIIVNHKTIAAVGASFRAAFRMMIHEI